MSEQEMNSYRFLSGDEPGDERLSQIMREVTAEAKTRRLNAESSMLNEVSIQRAALRERWNDRINTVING